MGEPNRFIYYGRFAPNKNVERLIDVFALLSRNNPAVKCDLIGEDVTGVWQRRDDKERARLSSLGLTYHGPISDAQLAPLVHRSRFFISASLYEGFGLAVVEAMAAGKIPVVNKIPSMQAIIDHGVNGYLVDFSDPDTAAKEIEAVLALPKAAHDAVSAKAIASSAKYGWDAKVDEFLRQYERASSGAARHNPGLNH
jgi:alpha-1,3-mannosyltransferase